MQFLFFCISALVILSALCVIFAGRPVYAILSLILCLYGIGALFLMLKAEFLAIVHLIIYAGAIMVLFLFAIMLMNLDSPESLNRSQLMKWVALIIAGGLFTLILIAMAIPSLAVSGIVGAVQPIGHLLFTQFVAPFELSTILFLAAVTGIVVTAKTAQSTEADHD